MIWGVSPYLRVLQPLGLNRPGSGLYARSSSCQSHALLPNLVQLRQLQVVSITGPFIMLRQDGGISYRGLSVVCLSFNQAWFRT